MLAVIMKYVKPKKKEMKTERVYRIGGMICNHCKNNVEKALASVEGVAAVRVDLAEGAAYVEGDARAADIIGTIEALGYEYSE